MSELFNLNPNDDQQMMIDVLHRFAIDDIKDSARQADEDAALPDGYLQKTVDLGLNFMPIPESLGGVGAGRTYVSNVLNIEQLATGDMSMAIAALTPLAVINAVMDWGTDQQREAVANSLATDKFTPAALALMEPGLGFNIDELATSAALQEDGSYRLNGVKSMVAYGDKNECLLVFAQVRSEESAEQKVQGFIIPADLDGVNFEREDYMGLRALPLYKMTLNDVDVSATTRLGDDFDIARLHQLSKIAIAALAVGCCQSVLDYVVPYVNERVAFGEPIANRQGVAFMVADMATEIEALRLMVYRAAAQAQQGLDVSRSAYLVHRQAIKYGMKVGTDGVQLLGGHGFTREYPVEMWYRNLRALSTLDGMLIV